MKKKLALAVVFAAGLGVSAAQAAVSLVSLGGLGANDSISWGQLGGNGTSVALPAAVSSAGSLGATVSSSVSTFERRNQGVGWAGNFANGEQLLWTQNQTVPMTITFGSAVSGAGAQIQSNAFGAFTATIEAFNGMTSLGSFNLAGNSTSAGDNSAIFIGLLSTAADITSIRFSVASRDFAIGTLQLNTTGVGAVPEPATWAMMLIGFAGLGYAARRRQAASAA